MGEVLGRLADASNGQLESRDFRGTTIYEFEMPTQSPTGDFGTKVAGLSVAKDHFMFATEVELLEEVIRGDSGDSLVSSEKFKKAISGVPTDGFSLSYSNTSEVLKPIYSFVQSGGFNEMIEQNPQAAFALELIGDLPSFDSISQFFGTSVAYGVQDSDGILTTTIFYAGEE